MSKSSLKIVLLGIRFQKSISQSFDCFMIEYPSSVGVAFSSENLLPKTCKHKFVKMNCESSDCLPSTHFVSGALLQGARVAEWVSWSIGSLVAISFLAVDGWRAFQKKQHWIPCDSLHLGALTLLLLTLLNIPSAFLHFPQDDYVIETSVQNILCCPDLISRRMLVLAGRVSFCVVMGCMLPGLARPRSSTLTLWSDMVALIITCLTPILNLSHEIYSMTRACFFSGYGDLKGHFYLALLKLLIVTITVFVAFIALTLILICAALASISIHNLVSHKIPVILSNSTLQINHGGRHSRLSWERVEDQLIKVWIVVCTSNPQYIIARSILSSSVALVITILNGILVFEILRTKFTMTFFFSLHCLVIVLGSSVIYWRSITSLLFLPKNVEKQWASIIKYFKIEDFWKRFLLELKDGHKSHRQMGDSYFKKLMLKMVHRLRVRKLIPLAVWLQVLVVFSSKLCWLVSQLLLSNIYLRKFFISSAIEECPNLYVGSNQREIKLEKFSCHEKYLKALVTMSGENAACLWVANRKYIEGIKTQFKRGQEEGYTCEELVAFLKNKSSSGYRCSPPRKSGSTRLQVEREFKICQCSCKMRAVSIITIIVELYPFIQDVEKATKAMKACSQAWNIVDLVEKSDGEALLVSEVADKVFQGLHKRGNLLHHNHKMLVPSENPLKAARAVVEDLAEKAKKTAEEYSYRTWNEVVKGYNLWRVSEHIDFESFNKVEGIIDELERMLADEMGSCMGKALDVIMEDSEQWATMAMEQSIWKAAYIAGKVKSVTDKLGWMLMCNAKEAINNASSSSIANPTLKKHPTFQIG